MKIYILLFFLSFGLQFLSGRTVPNISFYLKSKFLVTNNFELPDPYRLTSLTVRIGWQKITSKKAIRIRGTDKMLPWSEPIIEADYILQKLPVLESEVLSISQLKKVTTPENLGFTTFIQPQETAIKKVARGIMGAETNVYKIALKISDWIYRNIKYIPKLSGLLPAKEILKTKQADSAGYSLLFTSFARACGIPAKICFGLAYKQNKFEFHSWASFFAGKRWIGIDPSTLQKDINPSYITLFEGDESIFKDAVEITEFVIKSHSIE